MRYGKRWELPGVTFYEVESHGFKDYKDQTLYAYGKPGEMDHRGLPKTGELFESLDRAMIAWVGEKYTGPRGAGGTGVGTAADWFARMIGMDTLVAVNHAAGQKAVGEILEDLSGGPAYIRARAMTAGLEARGLVLATLNHG